MAAREKADLYSKNISLFKKRFPSIPITEGKGAYRLIPAKNGSITAKDTVSECRIAAYRGNGALLHSQYNPEREAQKLVDETNKSSAIFLGFGLGYAPVAWAKKHIASKDKNGSEDGGALILIENDSGRFFDALHIIDWSAVFCYPRLIIALNCPAEKTIPLITSAADISDCAVFAVPSQTAHDAPYFSAVASLIARNKRKEEINNATTKRFAKRWIENILRNVKSLNETNVSQVPSSGLSKDGVTAPSPAIIPLAFNHLPKTDSPAVILAAGPSLQDVLPRLAEIKRHAIIIAVDTALKAALLKGVEPDYIVLSDPQYYAWRHIAGLSSPSSILVTDLAAYPAVLRFDCRAIFLTQSAIPLAQYFEKIMRLSMPSLGAGGSVASSAWNLSRLLGAKRIYLAGLDLSFPRGETHIRGSTAEEAAHAVSSRVCTAQNASVPRLLDGNAEKGIDYNGNEVATDSKMKMFAWWFESRLSETAAAGEGIKTYTLCPAGLCIPGVEVTDVEALMSLPLRKECRIPLPDAAPLEAGNDAVALLKRGIKTLKHLATEAEHTTDTNLLQSIAKEMKENTLMRGLFFTEPRIKMSSPASIKALAAKTLDALSLLQGIAERSHVF